jgi:F-box domain
MTSNINTEEPVEELNIKATSIISLPDLPSDVFILVIERLEAWDIVRCQMVSVAWRKAFTASKFLRIAIRKYPHAREARQLSSNAMHPASARDSDLQWRTMFNKIACRYFHLTHGRSRTIQKYKTAIPARLRLAHWFPVSPFDYHESQPGGRLCYSNPWDPYNHHELRPGEQTTLFQHSFWSCEDGLLVFVPTKPFVFDYDAAELPVPTTSSHLAIMVFDLEAQRGVQVPFDIKDKVVRNFRLKDRTLIIEWAEKKPYHALNDLEYVHRHFASCYDIRSQAHSGVAKCCRWTVTLRSEWKLHFLGLPLNTCDRFFSTHTKDHYAIYLWQPNRSMYTGDEDQPIECLLVWDISQPRQYLPSQDPGGKGQPDDIYSGPHVVSRFNYRDLCFYGIRQQSWPSLMNFSLDSVQHTVTVRENACIAGQGYFDPAERLWRARTTSILFQGRGPHLRREWDGNLPPYRGNCSMESCDTLETEKWFLGIMDVIDHKADVRFSLAESVFTGRDMQNTTCLRIRTLGRMATLDQSSTKQIAYTGKIAGDERFLIGQNDSLEIVVLRFD